MKDFLAERLLVKIMKWEPEEISKEIPLLQALANFKYDYYQQYSTGIRFIESLVRWLKQFDIGNERNIAYNFIKDHLIFISNDQIAYLVSIAFNNKINPIIITKTAKQINISQFYIRKILNSAEYKSNLRKSLFIGLSDGSRIDYLRRCSGIDNEQVLTTYEISVEKCEDLLTELNKAESKLTKFNTIILVDDFTASGKSYFRIEEKKGKILKFLTNIFEKNDSCKLFDIKELEIHILFYIATKDSLDSLISDIATWKDQQNISIIIEVDAILVLNSTIKEKIEANNDFIILAMKYFDDRIINKHYKKGKYEKPYLGFNECGLPLVLNHNTPNNSLPILWLPDDMNYNGLFPRVTRHKS